MSCGILYLTYHLNFESHLLLRYGVTAGAGAFASSFASGVEGLAVRGVRGSTILLISFIDKAI